MDHRKQGGDLLRAEGTVEERPRKEYSKPELTRHIDLKSVTGLITS